MKNASFRLAPRRLLGASLVLTFVVLAMSVGPFSNSQSLEGNFVLKNVSPVTQNGEYSMPVWSPDGQRLLLASAHGMKLHLLDLNTGKLEQLSNVPGSGFDASWSPDGSQVFFRHRDNELQVHPEIRAINLSDRQQKSTSLHPNGLLSASKARRGQDLVVYINVESLGIEARRQDGSDAWKITTDDGQYYRPLLSPNQQQLVVHQGSEMWLYALDGSGPIRSLGQGLASCWSPDGSHILAFMDESEDGHTISGSELYLIDPAQGQMEPLTRTPQVYELWPNWSPDGKRIAFEDARTGQIMVADIVQE